jgi:hypothetical protein
MEEGVLDPIHRNAGIGKREEGEELNISQMTIWRVVQKQMLCPHNLQRVQCLVPIGFSAVREKFFQCFVQRSAEYFSVSSVLAA